ncbi:MAG: SIS domain-containing protein [Candidatus Omnitrophota bacterium]
MIQEILNDSICLKQEILTGQVDIIYDIVRETNICLGAGGKVILVGNGGSAADAQHLAAEFVGRFLRERRALPAIALSVNTSILTALGNDYGYDTIFSRQIEAMAGKNDILWAFSTSGQSKNVNKAVMKARAIGVKTVAFAGNNGGRLAAVADISFIVPSQSAPRIQEAHITVGHIVCQLVEEGLSVSV